MQDPFPAEKLVALVSDFEKLACEAAVMVRENQAKLAALISAAATVSKVRVNRTAQGLVGRAFNSCRAAPKSGRS